MSHLRPPIDFHMHAPRCATCKNEDVTVQTTVRWIRMPQKWELVGQPVTGLKGLTEQDTARCSRCGPTILEWIVLND